MLNSNAQEPDKYQRIQLAFIRLLSAFNSFDTSEQENDLRMCVGLVDVLLYHHEQACLECWMIDSLQLSHKTTLPLAVITCLGHSRCLNSLDLLFNLSFPFNLCVCVCA